ncbi:unnamed protein product [Cochlearia groenlandica]
MWIIGKAAYCQPIHMYYRPCSCNLQNPISLFAITSPISVTPSSEPYIHKQQQQPQFGHLIIPTIAVSASAWFFTRLHQNPPIITTPPPPIYLQQQEQQEDEEEDEDVGAIKELPLYHKPGYVKSLHFYKLKPGSIFKLIDVYYSDNYKSLKARIRLSTDWLESARRELDAVVGRDPLRVIEYSQVLDELMDILRDMELYIDMCEKDNVKGYLISCNRMLARVRKMEAHILNILQQFLEDQQT